MDTIKTEMKLIDTIKDIRTEENLIHLIKKFTELGYKIEVDTEKVLFESMQKYNVKEEYITYTLRVYRANKEG